MFGCSLVFVIADVVNALLIRVIGQNLQISYNQRLKALSLDAIAKEKGNYYKRKDNSFKFWPK